MPVCAPVSPCQNRTTATCSGFAGNLSAQTMIGARPWSTVTHRLRNLSWLSHEWGWIPVVFTAANSPAVMYEPGRYGKPHSHELKDGPIGRICSQLMDSLIPTRNNIKNIMHCMFSLYRPTLVEISCFFSNLQNHTTNTNQSPPLITYIFYTFPHI